MTEGEEIRKEDPASGEPTIILIPGAPVDLEPEPDEVIPDLVRVARERLAQSS